MDTKERTKVIILPIFLTLLGGIVGGVIAPMFVEKWKEGGQITKKIVIMEEKIKKIEESIKQLNTKIDDKIPYLEHELKDVELQVSHEAGILKGRLPKEAPKPAQVIEDKK